MADQMYDEVVETTPDDEGYARGLGSRQIQMIAIGGAIGTGLFLGAGTAISKAGPSLILSYAVAGVVIFAIMRALGELLTYRPVTGSFAEYAREFLGPFAGFVTGWTYWLFWVVTGMAETTAAAVYVKYWAPGIPQWLSALVFLVILYAANLISVKLFGEIEFWFSMVKVTAILGMILIGIGVLTLGFSKAGDTASVTHLWQDGGFFPKGIGSTLMTLQIVMFAYLGVELVGVTAGESENPAKTLPRAINTLPLRIVLFYIGSLTIILCLVPWTEFKPGVSPFVAAFGKIGIPAAAGIINFVVLTAALSSCNSGMYSTGRMLRDLALRGQAPGSVTKLNRHQSPALAITVSALLMGVGVLLNYVAPGKAFTYVTSVATVCGIWTWAIILICQLRYRAAWRAGHLPAPTFKAPGGPWVSWAALAFLGLVVVLIAFDPDNRISLYVFPVWAVLLVIGFQVLKRRRPEAVHGVAHDHLRAKSGH
ncbi:amino acid permease [Kitasatospora sp. MAP5-34]|uniref:amino acid permease n=1 Tax=Kitasatospora sp. MAP5-34 TaxID=3035102 RepID=UPI002476E274|nr:amino acid permease [Kitasatospora sp. MAP5-34]MDH6577128.1 AAT family amino acid transporter [Kitasatospora sp. MAP5-34]